MGTVSKTRDVIDKSDALVTELQSEITELTSVAVLTMTAVVCLVAATCLVIVLTK